VYKYHGFPFSCRAIWRSSIDKTACLKRDKQKQSRPAYTSGTFSDIAAGKKGPSSTFHRTCLHSQNLPECPAVRKPLIRVQDIPSPHQTTKRRTPIETRLCRTMPERKYMMLFTCTMLTFTSDLMKDIPPCLPRVPVALLVTERRTDLTRLHLQDVMFTIVYPGRWLMEPHTLRIDLNLTTRT
jgi:hypothetical protein